MKSNEEEEGNIIVFRSPIRRGRAKVNSVYLVLLMRTRSTSTKKRMRTTTPKSATATAAKSSPQSGRAIFETADMVVETDADENEGTLSDDDLSVST